MALQDITLRQPIGISSIPTGIGNFGSLSFTVAAAGNWSVNIFWLPDTPRLTMWNVRYSFFIDHDNDFNYIFPNGPSLTSGQLSLLISQWNDAKSSNDQNGLLNTKVNIFNLDTAPHTIYFYFKAYTYSVVPGGSS